MTDILVRDVRDDVVAFAETFPDLAGTEIMRGDWQ